MCDMFITVIYHNMSLWLCCNLVIFWFLKSKKKFIYAFFKLFNGMISRDGRGHFHFIGSFSWLWKILFITFMFWDFNFCNIFFYLTFIDRAIVKVVSNFSKTLHFAIVILLIKIDYKKSFSKIKVSNIRHDNITWYKLSVILWRSVLMMEEIGENHRPATSHWQTLSYNVVSSAPCHEQHSNSQLQW